jgi:hypothetical protein
MVIKMPQLGLQETFIPIKKKAGTLAPSAEDRQHLAVRVRVRLVRLVERMMMMIVVGILRESKINLLAKYTRSNILQIIPNWGSYPNPNPNHTCMAKFTEITSILIRLTCQSTPRARLARDHKKYVP